jgi:hypothetical protein
MCFDQYFNYRFLIFVIKILKLFWMEHCGRWICLCQSVDGILYGYQWLEFLALINQ